MGIKYLISSLLVAIASVSFSSNAAVVYVYTGNNYDFLFTSPSMFDTSMSITGSFTVDSKLINVNGDISAQVTSYSFSDGVTTYSDADPEGFTSQFLVNTDSNGNITNWLIDIFDISYYSPNLEPGDIANRIISIGGDQDIAIVSQCDFLVVTCTFTQIDGASTMINPGSWSVVPIPAAIWLFGSGLIGLIGIARRRK